MHAIVYTQYGPPEVMEWREVDKPTPNDNQVLVRVSAASINAADWHSLHGDPALFRPLIFGFPTPKNTRLGLDVAGRVEAVGRNVTQFRPGDEVFGCARGSFAEYALAAETELVMKPAAISFEQAAAVPVAAVTAMHAIRWAGGIRPGQRVVINGASGGVGTFAVQLAKHYGANVTAVCSKRNVDMVRSLGADHVIDYTQEDFTRQGQQYDLIMGVNGYHPLWDYRRVLSANGAYVCAGGLMPQYFQALLLGSLLSRNGKRMGSMGVAKVTHEDLLSLAELLAEGKIVPVIDGCYPLSETVAAFRYFEDVHAKGKVVLTANNEGNRP